MGIDELHKLNVEVECIQAMNGLGGSVYFRFRSDYIRPIIPDLFEILDGSEYIYYNYSQEANTMMRTVILIGYQESKIAQGLFNTFPEDIYITKGGK